MHPILAFFESPIQWMVIMVIAVLLFGNRLPQVARSLGKGMLEFRKGLKGLEDDFDEPRTATRSEPGALEPPRPPQRIATPTPRFEDTGAQQPPPQG